MTNLTNNKAVLSWIDEMTAITKPDKIVWITGEEEQLGALREQAVKEGILIKLNPDKLPGCYLHRTDPDDVARVEDRTFICCEKEEDAGPTNHWVEPKEMYERMYALADGAYKGRTMYIIPYSMSIIGSPFAKYGFELTDSIYVVLNMHIMTRIVKVARVHRGEGGVGLFRFGLRFRVRKRSGVWDGRRFGRFGLAPRVDPVCGRCGHCRDGRRRGIQFFKIVLIHAGGIERGVSVESQRADKAQRQQEKGTRGHERSP